MFVDAETIPKLGIHLKINTLINKLIKKESNDFHIVFLPFEYQTEGSYILISTKNSEITYIFNMLKYILRT